MKRRLHRNWNESNSLGTPTTQRVFRQKFTTQLSQYSPNIPHISQSVAIQNTQLQKEAMNQLSLLLFWSTGFVFSKEWRYDRAVWLLLLSCRIDVHRRFVCIGFYVHVKFRESLCIAQGIFFVMGCSIHVVVVVAVDGFWNRVDDAGHAPVQKCINLTHSHPAWIVIDLPGRQLIYTCILRVYHFWSENRFSSTGSTTEPDYTVSMYFNIHASATHIFTYTHIRAYKLEMLQSIKYPWHNQAH